jgi:hypothetical protein
VIRRLPRTIALAIIIGVGIFNIYQAVIGWTLSDAGAYWNAAMRLREGAELYPTLASVDASEVYRYAPWFAWLTVPVTYLPVQLAGALWSAVLLGASAAALVPLVRMRAWLLVAFFGPILVGISAVGNVHALMLAPLMWTINRRSGPVWVAISASLKIFPLLLALVYAGRGQWRRFAVSVLLTGVLWAPALLYDLSDYAVRAGEAAALYNQPVLYVLVGGAAVGVTLALAMGRYGWLSAATAVVVALPRIFVYDVSYLMLGLADIAETRRSARSIE